MRRKEKYQNLTQIKEDLIMPKLKGQLDGFDYPKSIGKVMHNVLGPVGSRTPAKGEPMDTKQSKNHTYSMNMKKTPIKGQLA